MRTTHSNQSLSNYHESRAGSGPMIRNGRLLLQCRHEGATEKTTRTAGKPKHTIMSILTKWNPLGKSEQFDIFRPSLRWDPVREMEDLMRGMQRAFTSWPARTDESMTLAEWAPSVDIGETDKEYVVKAELPEVRKEDIRVNVDEGTLSISGERKAEKEDKGVRYHRLERSYGRFERSFSLPDEADTSKITSEYKEGILTVHLPKNPQAKHAPHAIPVS
jgi:HSP20 family protein